MQFYLIRLCNSTGYNVVYLLERNRFVHDGRFTRRLVFAGRLVSALLFPRLDHRDIRVAILLGRFDQPKYLLRFILFFFGDNTQSRFFVSIVHIKATAMKKNKNSVSSKENQFRFRKAAYLFEHVIIYTFGGIQFCADAFIGR